MLWAIGIGSVVLLWWLVGDTLKQATMFGTSHPDDETGYLIWVRLFGGLAALAALSFLGCFEDRGQTEQIIIGAVGFIIGMAFAPTSLCVAIFSIISVMLCR